MSHWTSKNIASLTGRNALVTGANSGLGLETARGLARAGATVFMGCRNADKAEQAMASIKQDHPEADLRFIALDLADLASVQHCARQLIEQTERLDLLINNAGVMALPERQTADGFEMQIGTNHLGHFALTGQLLDHVEAAEAGRVVTVSSIFHKLGRINLDDLNWQSRKYDAWRAYGQAKLANLMFALTLDRRLRAAGRRTISVASHPGYAATHLQLAGPEMKGSTIGGIAMQLGNRVFAQSQAKGALPSLYAATAADVKGGEYIGPDGFRELWGHPQRAQIAGRAQKTSVADPLWALSTTLTGVEYPV